MTDLTVSKRQTTCIKGVSILLVILGHMSLIDFSGAWGVHIFLILSGYGIFYSYESTGLHNFWKKRMEAVWLPYVFSTVIFLIIRILLKEKITVISMIITIVGLDFSQNIDPTMWYISYILASYGIFWLMMKIPNKRTGIVIAGFLQIIITALGYFPIAWNHGTIAWAYIFSFPLGILFGYLRNRQIKVKIKKMLLLFITLASLAFVIFRYGKAHASFEELAYTLIAAIGIITFLNLIQLENLPIVGNGMYILGKISFFMYLNEYFVLSHMGILKEHMNAYLADLIMLASSICIAAVMQMVWNLISKKWHMNTAH